MRDILIFALVFATLPFILRHPHIGVLVWSWLSYMNPHRLTWGLAYGFPFAQLVALTLFASLFLTREKLRLPVNATVVIWLLFILWMGVTTLFAIYPESSLDYYIRVIKIQLITFLTMVLINDRERMHQLLWVIVCSIGFYSFKGGIFTIVTGGSWRVWGAPDSYIEENNALAVATMMVIPLMIYLARLHWQRPWVRAGLMAAIFLSTVSVLGSQSRGALVGIVAVVGVLWLKSSFKLASGLAMVMFAVLLFNFMPQSWHDRMGTIQNYQEDESAMGRINAWTYSINVANDRITGAGFESWSKSTFAVWAPNPEAVHAAHSIYFSVLADHGWIGLPMFLAILGLTWRTLSRVVRAQGAHRSRPDDILLAKMLQISMVAYMSGGAFLQLSYFDLPWHIIAIAILLERQVLAAASEAASDEPAADAQPSRRRWYGELGTRRESGRMRK